nr:hypothetical protein [Hymenobacter qilianensis]
MGLSLSYDIITQGHGGTLTVDSQEGEFTEFTIELPQSPAPEKAPRRRHSRADRTHPWSKSNYLISTCSCG